MGFLLLGTAVWLLDALSAQAGSEGVQRTLWYLLITGLFAWLIGQFGLVKADTAAQRSKGKKSSVPESSPFKKKIILTAFMFITLVVIGLFFIRFDDYENIQTEGTGSVVKAETDLIKWQHFSEDNIKKYQKQGKTIFLDFTADWCLNCKANETAVLETETISELFKKNNIAALKADYTRKDPIIAKWLKAFGRAGVPMYIVIPACKTLKGVKPLPELLTKQTVIDAINKAGASKSSNSCK